MTDPSEKWRERLLYLISPIGLLLLWQILVGLGFGEGLVDWVVAELVGAGAAGAGSTVVMVWVATLLWLS